MLTILLRLRRSRAARSSRGAVLIADAALTRLFLGGATVDIFRFGYQTVLRIVAHLLPCDTKCAVEQSVWDGASVRGMPAGRRLAHTISHVAVSAPQYLLTFISNG